MRVNSILKNGLKIAKTLSVQVCLIVLGANYMAVEASTPAVKGDREYLSMVPAEAPMVEGTSFINKMEKASDAFDTYYFEYKMTAFKHGTVVEEGKLWFKKPHLLRLEEVGQYKHGCVALLTPSGKVKAHAGGAISMFVVELSPESNMLRSANGYPMVKSDLHSLAVALQKFLAEGKTAKVTEAPVQISSQNEKVFILEVYQNNGQQIYKRVAIDTQSTLPVEWWDYEGGKLVSHSVWKTFKANPPLADSLFEDTNRK